MHRGLSFAVQYIKVDADDLCASYTQEREPGPLPNPRCHMEGRDGAAISIRRLLLLPDHLGDANKTNSHSNACYLSYFQSIWRENGASMQHHNACRLPLEMSSSCSSPR